MNRTRLNKLADLTYFTALPERWAIFGIMLIATIVRFFSIAKASIWHDEGFSVMLASRTPAQIWAGSARDVHPPLYYELLHGWMSIFGTSEIAVRSLSAVAGLMTLLIAYLLIKKYFGRAAATISLSILAVAPMLVRYSQEARMYGVLGVFLLAGTYALLRASDHAQRSGFDRRWLVVYILAMAAGMYTHYFAALAIIAHWLYLMTLEKPWKWRVGKSIWLTSDWWVTNAAIMLVWLPWLPSFWGQFTRGQGISWISPTTLYTLPKSVWQSLTFTDAMALPPYIFWMIPGLILGLIVWIAWLHKHEHKQVRALFWYTLFPIIATISISIIKPIYQDRYLVFAATGLYMLLGIALTRLIRQHQISGMVAYACVLLICGIGITNVVRQATHSMRTVGQYVNERYEPGDSLVSAELYTYFDFSYYCKHCTQYGVKTANIGHTTLQLNTSASSYGRPNGYGESSLLYDQADSIYRDNLADAAKSGSRVWLIGKPGTQKYWNTLPATWQQLDQVKTNSSEARLYQVQ